MRQSLWIIFFLVLSVVSSDVQPASGGPEALPATSQTLVDITPNESCKEQVFTTSDLMVGGKRIDDPLRHGVSYYLAPEYLRWQKLGPENSVNFAKRSGLFLSKDDGKTWHVLSQQFEFKYLFIHPITGEFFAIIDYQWLETNKNDGFLEHCHATKIIRSADGKKWKDITRNSGFVCDLVYIFQDPEHPNRICAFASTIRLMVYQYTDDNYSDWKGICAGTWWQAHPQAKPAGDIKGAKIRN